MILSTPNRCVEVHRDSNSNGNCNNINNINNVNNINNNNHNKVKRLRTSELLTSLEARVGMNDGEMESPYTQTTE